GAGKTAFATRLAHSLGNAAVIHTDDFASWENQREWWPDLEVQVLRPLARGETASYVAYDWAARRPGERREIAAREVILLEGVSSARRAVFGRLTLAVWVEA